MKATNFEVCSTFFHHFFITHTHTHTHTLSLSLSLSQVQIIYFYALFNKSLNMIISLKGSSKLWTFIPLAHQLSVWCVYFHLKILRQICEDKTL